MFFLLEADIEEREMWSRGVVIHFQVHLSQVLSGVPYLSYRFRFVEIDQYGKAAIFQIQLKDLWWFLLRSIMPGGYEPDMRFLSAVSTKAIYKSF